MTREEQVRAALVVLSPTKDEREKCIEDIELALAEVEDDSLDPRPNSKKIRAAVKQLHAALRNCQIKFKGLHRFDEAHAYELMMVPLDLNDHIAACKEWIDDEVKPRRRAAKQKSAVAHARALVRQYRKEKKERTVRRGNAWHQLSAVLAGDPQLDLFRHMRDINRT
jgi:hypothetical protein